MSIHIEVNSNKVIDSVNAKRGKIELAIVRALNRTALWLKAQAAKEISEEKKIKLTIMRKRLRIFKARTSRLEVFDKSKFV
jgi:Prophage minor tail protein Z (GPZ).